MLKKYLDDIFKTTFAGDVREESYYPDLKNFLVSWTENKNKTFHITPLPKRTEGSNPDFRVLTNKKELVGYIEAKALTVDNLDQIEDNEQLKRYRNTFPNLILTNFLEFRLYRNGQLIDQVSIGRPFIIHQLKIAPPVENQEKFLNLLEQFFSFSISTTTTAKALAIELAKRTRFLRDNVIAEELKEENVEGTQTLEGFYKAFKDHLIFSFEPNDFANLFAQTITYGLFAARSRAKEDFNRKLAYEYIPPTIGILKDVFRFISSTDLPQSMEWIVDDIAEVLRCSDVKKIMENFYKEGKGRDPIIHFYETFLAEYDPKEREKRGVYYTPEPVVSYITRSIHKLLKEKFDKSDGFADKSVVVLDPAAGTLTFPAYAIDLAISEFKEKYGEGGINSLVKDHILKDFYAFELMMAPYAIGHLKIGLILDNIGYQLSDMERFNLFLTNTLDFSKEDPNQFPGVFEQTIAKESQEALKVKEEVPVMVVMGNPPYSGVSDNKGEWILKQIEEYKQIDGKSLGEQKYWLQDDYVKFLRFAQWKLDQNKNGILGFITNHAWLDNPTFRGMRASFLKTFDEIYILNLHGSNLKKEKTPDGGKDENVFDIQTGVAITIGIKNKNLKQKKVYYADLWGLREEKYARLEKSDIFNSKWEIIKPSSEYYFFVPRNEEGSEIYKKFLNLKEIFPINSTGVVTARDEFVIDNNRQSLETKIRIFIDSNNSNEYVKEFLRSTLRRQEVENYAWRIEKARHQLQKENDIEEFFTKILYRPFDEKHIFYHPAVVWRTRDNVMSNMLKPNLALISARSNRLDHIDSFFCSDKIVETKCGESTIQSYTFPLFIYNDLTSQQTIFDGQEKIDIEGVQHSLRKKEEKKPNMDEKLINDLKKNFGTMSTPEEIFYYIYAIVYSNIYREKYKEFLKTDFPRIPFTKNLELFQKLAELGKKLVDFHLLKSTELDNPISKFEGDGENTVDNIRYLPIKIDSGSVVPGQPIKFPPTTDVGGLVRINDNQFFTDIYENVWNYYIGGYQVLNKWLKSRKGKILSSEVIKTYCKIATAIHHTILIQKEIDRLYPEVEKDLIKVI